MTPLVWLAVLLAGCHTVDSAAQGGAQFREVGVVQSSLPPEAMFAVCWPVASTGSVNLMFQPNDVMFDAHDGATNSTARCIREIATAVTWSPRPTSLVVQAPSKPAAGFVVLAWVKLLSSTRYAAERGLVDPAPLVRACLSLGTPRASTRFEVSHDPGFAVRTIPAALSDSERCIEAVLSSATWPSTRGFSLAFDEVSFAPPAEGDVSFYATPNTSSEGALEPVATREALSLKQAVISTCWAEARTRRAGLGGSKTFRFRSKNGSVTNVWSTSNTSELTFPAVDYRFDACLASAVKSTRFGSASGDGVYTWLFASVSR